MVRLLDGRLGGLNGLSDVSGTGTWILNAAREWKVRHSYMLDAERRHSFSGRYMQDSYFVGSWHLTSDNIAVLDVLGRS